MKDYTGKRLTVVTAILPKEKAGDIIAAAIPRQLAMQVLINARGTLYKTKWYHNLRPVISPEKTILEMLVPESLSHTLMNNLSEAAGLHDSGTGILYSVHCEKAVFMSGSMMVPDIPERRGEPVIYKHRLYAIHCITQKGKAEDVSAAAIRAGAHGPIVLYGQGRGIRERIGLLRIAISPEKELIQLVVDHYNTEPVLDAMINEGRLFAPGMGFIYVVPVEKAIVKVPIVSTKAKELAHHYEIIKAIDELKGGSNWRLHNDGSHIGKRAYLGNMARITCVVERGRSVSLLEAATAAGAPGASISFGIDNGIEKTSELGITINREVEKIEITLSQKIVNSVLDAVVSDAQRNGSAYDYFYVQDVSKAFTYQH